MEGKVTTHVLDTALGKPAHGLGVELYRLQPAGSFELIANAWTNADGRLDEPLVSGARLEAGFYELRFRVGDYFERIASPVPTIWNVVPIAFHVRDAAQHYHIPLLIAPGAYSTYRGS
ncbi:hydroxyisourate hydrolase [Paenibacillus nanensis]|uniref:5-hydroxyisourate hydrolase n=1 Tax=Paenibacillus nanensis TaxID=393251 RepID=A0A3A1UU02_9BACL|nr:hydroxyisourate hydrolase [Paenibacillus nanensis]RIX51725.1 hydroxyisourate hydrolase [Paenibacillus nanensis]